MASVAERFTCPICCDIFQKPVQLPCKHVYCRQCLENAAKRGRDLHVCAVCKDNFNLRDVQPTPDIERRLDIEKDACRGCKKLMTLSELRMHTSICAELLKTVKETRFKPVAKSSQHIPSNVPNRSTFNCPFCAEKNLDCEGLREHCMGAHRHCDQRVVCPVCAAMPWGDPNMKSANFLQHLNTRHKFEYETYVDYGEDEDAMLQKAVQASLNDN
ncbi:RING finger protein 166 [Lingula anatina]|uniref:RING finger protein 166 n=1 Tax=Lingula anatina TaxID=7574 RepID=A0A1S3H5H0_LINAN|nr:RING finger protein 166 [Lingula anatina]|eukprot:XP_013381385.1 RING finger protein 166 [Lingula anatina]